MKTFKGFMILGLLTCGSQAIAMDEISRKAAEATANALTVTVQGASAIVGCTMVVKGIKAGVPYLNAIDNEKAAPYISGGCTALYAAFLITAARAAVNSTK